MPTKAEFADARFQVSEFAKGEPFISTLENGPQTNKILSATTAFIMILKDGTTHEEAERLVQHMNAHVKQISIQQYS